MAVTPPRSNIKTNPLFIALPEEKVYTCGDRVQGTVRVDPSLRPSRIHIDLEGYAVIHETSSGLRPHLFKLSKELFISEGAHENLDILRRGTASDGRVELPFEFTFPDVAVSPPPPERNWHYPDDSFDHPRFQHSFGFSLPPSVTGDLFSRNPNLLAGPKIVYALRAFLDSNVNPITVVQELPFLPQAPEYDLRLLQPHLELGTKLPGRHSRTKLIRTRKLLPYYKDVSKLTKLKDILIEKELFFGLETLTEIPFAKFNVLANPARVLVLGSAVPAVITVQHVSRSKSLPSEPDLFIRRIHVMLQSSLHVFTPQVPNSKGPAKNNVEIIHDTLTLFDRKYDTGNGLPLFDGLKLAELGTVELAHPKLLPSFTSYGMALEYELQIDIFGECASHGFHGIACREKVQVVAPWKPPVPEEDSGPGLVTAPEPEYQEVDPMASQSQSVAGERPPMLQRPPMYFDELPPSATAPGSSLVPQPTQRPLPPPYTA